jgi:hypothetical protein
MGRGVRGADMIVGQRERDAHLSNPAWYEIFRESPNIDIAFLNEETPL